MALVPKYHRLEEWIMRQAGVPHNTPGTGINRHWESYLSIMGHEVFVYEFGSYSSIGFIDYYWLGQKNTPSTILLSEEPDTSRYSTQTEKGRNIPRACKTLADYYTIEWVPCCVCAECEAPCPSNDYLCRRCRAS